MMSESVVRYANKGLNLLLCDSLVVCIFLNFVLRVEEISDQVFCKDLYKGWF